MRLSDTVSKREPEQYFRVVKIQTSTAKKTIIVSRVGISDANRLRDLHENRLAGKGYTLLVEPNFR
jgi:hypothetical protein